jgi:hypothetical protein
MGFRECHLLPLEKQEPWDLLTQVGPFPWRFRVKVVGNVLGEAWSSKLLCVPGSRNYHWVMEPRAAWKLQGHEIEIVELWVVLPVISFSLCGFRQGFASFWLWDPISAFCRPLILLFQGIWSPLGYEKVKNPPSSECMVCLYIGI